MYAKFTKLIQSLVRGIVFTCIKMFGWFSPKEVVVVKKFDENFEDFEHVSLDELDLEKSSHDSNLLCEKDSNIEYKKYLEDLGRTYELGTHSEGKNFTKAVECYLKANTPKSLYYLGRMYGRGTHPDGKDRIKETECYEKRLQLIQLQVQQQTDMFFTSQNR